METIGNASNGDFLVKMSSGEYEALVILARACGEAAGQDKLVYTGEVFRGDIRNWIGAVYSYISVKLKLDEIISYAEKAKKLLDKEG